MIQLCLAVAVMVQSQWAGSVSHIQHFAPPVKGATFSIVLLFWTLHSVIFLRVLECVLGVKSQLDLLRSQQNHPQVTTPSGKGGVPELLFHDCLFFSYICFSRFIVFNLLKEHSAENGQSLCYNVILKLVAI